MTTLPVVVIGGGVAGCAAAVAAATAGATTILIEASHFLGGVAVQGEHRTLCGLAPLDAAQAELLEPTLTATWVDYVSTGSAYRQGRVWLWPTTATTLQHGLRQRLNASGVDLRSGHRVIAARQESARLTVALADGSTLTAGAVIDASGAGVMARLLALPWAPARQWPAHRSTLHLPGIGIGTAARVAALRTAQAIVGGDAAIALVPIDQAAGTWQCSLDIAPGTSLVSAAAAAERIASALGGTVVSVALALAERDHGRPASSITVAELFAERERGLCWAAWPREEHGPEGVTWEWPSADRHGVPERAVRIVSGPAQLWCIGKGAPVSAEAASALRVTGTCLALGTVVGGLAARTVQKPTPIA